MKNLLLLLLLLVPTLSVAQTGFELFEAAVDESIEIVDDTTTYLLNREYISEQEYDNVMFIWETCITVAEDTQGYQKTAHYLVEPLENQKRLNDKVMMLARALRLLLETVRSKYET